jgi:hypothetical protein
MPPAPVKADLWVLTLSNRTVWPPATNGVPTYSSPLKPSPQPLCSGHHMRKGHDPKSTTPYNKMFRTVKLKSRTGSKRL